MNSKVFKEPALFSAFHFLPGVAVALKQAMTPEFRAYQRQVVANCRALAEALMGLGYRVVTGTAGSEPMGWPCSSSHLRPGVAVGRGLGRWP